MKRVAASCILLLWGCVEGNTRASDAGTDVVSKRKPFTLEQARDPEQCRSCHPNHYREWASSMHAYAAQDPVFVAMNRRAQREAHLGDFCVKCHAPMAVRLGKTVDGLNLDELPDALKGVTCYFCHNADRADADPDRPGLDREHNAKLHLTNDITMRGPITDPKQPGVHRSAYSPFFDEGKAQSSAMCGGCHDIVNHNNVHLERTFEEYKSSIFSRGSNQTSCIACHMDDRKNKPAADDPESHVGNRTVHEHLWPGVDVALTDFPNREAQRRAIECNLESGTLMFSFSPNFLGNGVTGDFQPGAFTAVIETQFGHRQPSGAAQDRRMWFEILAYDAAGNLVPGSSGAIADGEKEEKSKDEPNYDPQLWMFRDRIFDSDGNPTHNFWEAAPSAKYEKGYQDPPNTLPTAVDPSAAVRHFVAKAYDFGLDAESRIDRLIAHLRMRPIGVDVLQDLVASGDLDPTIVSQMPTFTMYGTEVEWKPGMINVQVKGSTLGCPNSYRCMLEPGSEYCIEEADAAAP